MVVAHRPAGGTPLLLLLQLIHRSEVSGKMHEYHECLPCIILEGNFVDRSVHATLW